MEKRNLKVTILIFVDMIFEFSRPHHYHQFMRYCYMTVLSMIMYSKGEKKIKSLEHKQLFHISNLNNNRG